MAFKNDKQRRAAYAKQGNAKAPTGRSTPLSNARGWKAPWRKRKKEVDAYAATRQRDFTQEDANDIRLTVQVNLVNRAVKGGKPPTLKDVEAALVDHWMPESWANSQAPELHTGILCEILAERAELESGERGKLRGKHLAAFQGAIFKEVTLAQEAAEYRRKGHTILTLRDSDDVDLGIHPADSSAYLVLVAP